MKAFEQSQRLRRKRTFMDYVMLAIFVLAFGGLGITLIAVGTRELFIQKRVMANAVEVEAVVLSATVKESTSPDTDRRLLRDNSTKSYVPEVRFAYTMGGVRYESDLLYPTVIVNGYASRERALEEIGEYTPGAKVRAYADASVPQRGFLRFENSANPKWFIVVGVLTLIFLAILSRFL
ncbi:MAG: DUF3592 domain-containing protein [Phycisphaeraceae bacterium]|nr:DUF3592 domain-containing protein [Phycisphaeraceae bacterium]